jgi:hypothetical protein
MKKQVYLLIPILMLLVAGQAIAQTEQVHITTYENFDGKYNEEYLSNYNPGEERVNNTFCEGSDIELNVVQQGEVEYKSFTWFHINGNRDESNLNNDANTLSFTADNTNYGVGYHLFRVYAYSEENQQGCFEVTEMAVYVLPQVVQEEEDNFEYCATDAPPVDEAGDANSFGQGQIVLDGTVNQANFPDTYEFNYQWVKVNVETEDIETIEGATGSTYVVGSGDTHTEVGEWEYRTVISYVVNGGECEQSLLIANITVTPAPEKPVINVTGGHSRGQ